MHSQDESPMPEMTPGPSLPAGSLPAPSDELELAVIEGLTPADPDRIPASSEGPGEAQASRFGVPDGPVADSLPLREDIKALGEQLTRRLDSLQTLFERELRAETARERVIDRLHAELQEYKQDLM